jgi:hypothetical protein
MGLEPTIPAFEWEKAFHASDLAATVTGGKPFGKYKTVRSRGPEYIIEMDRTGFRIALSDMLG